VHIYEVSKSYGFSFVTRKNTLKPARTEKVRSDGPKDFVMYVVESKP